MSEFMQQAAAPLATPLTWLKEFNRSGLEYWQAHSLPGKKTEAWKYTNLRSLEQGDYFKPAFQPVGDVSAHNYLAIPELQCHQLTFLDGQFSEQLSSLADLPEGVQVVRFSEANTEQQAAITQSLNSLADSKEHLFTALNTANTDDGVFLYVGKNTRLETPLQVVYSNSKQAHAYCVNQRLLVVLEQGSEATVIEHFAQGQAEQNSLINGVTELCIGENAVLNHYRFLLEDENALHIGSLNVGLKKSATFNSFCLGLGGKVKRVDMTVQHQGEGAHCEMSGVYLTRNSQHIDYHTCIVHAVPRCTTSEVFRGIIADSSRAVFNGRIHIHPQAQKTLAQLSNKNLLTSNKAEVDTKPELEIYADDVQCAHGATVAQLSGESMHYLQTRGVSEDEARVMLSFGFINELVNAIKLEPVANFLRPQLVKMFATDKQLARHLV